MDKWRICYREKGGDTANVWVYADSAEDAKNEAMSEYWDIDYIIDVYKI